MLVIYVITSHSQVRVRGTFHNTLVDNTSEFAVRC